MSGNVVMVTGGTGLVGAAIKAVVEDPALGLNPNGDKWVFLSSKDGDLRDIAQTRKIFERVKPTHVIHLAARVGGLFANMKYKVEFFRDNMAINDSVMECCKDFKVKKLVSCLSTCVFPDKTSYPIDESSVHLGPPHSSNEGYAYAKRLIDVMNRCYREQYGCNFTSVIPTNIYGEHDNFSLEDGHVIPALIHKCYLAKKNDTDFVMYGSGTPLRQFIYSKDLARLFVWALYHYDSPDMLIMSVPEEDEVTIREVVEMIADAFSLPRERIVADTSKADGQHKKTASPARLLELNPGFKFTPFKEAIANSVNWFVENYETARK